MTVGDVGKLLLREFRNPHQDRRSLHVYPLVGLGESHVCRIPHDLLLAAVLDPKKGLVQNAGAPYPPVLSRVNWFFPGFASWPRSFLLTYFRSVDGEAAVPPVPECSENEA